MASHFTTVTLVTLFCLVCFNSGERVDVFSKLVADLRKSNPHLEYMPIDLSSNLTDHVNVHFDCHLFNIANADPRTKEVELDAWVYIRWQTHTKWNPADYSGVERVIVPEEFIWMPDIFAYEAVTPLSNNGHEGVLLDHDGWATYLPKVRFSILCDIDPHRLATGVSCHVNFGFWNNDDSVTKMTLAGDVSEDAEMAYYFKGSRYEVTAHSAENAKHSFGCCPPTDFTAIKFNLTFKEKIPSIGSPGFIQGMMGMN